MTRTAGVAALAFLFSCAEGNTARGGADAISRIEMEEHMVPAADAGIELYLRNKHPQGMSKFSADRVVLFVHGATYPAETAFDLRLGGTSWMEYIAERGFDVWLVDVRGYGRSTRPPEMNEPPEKNAPIVRTDTAIRDVSTAIDFILRKRGVQKLDLIGWSWGTAMMGSYAAQNPDQVERLVLYAPLWVYSTDPLISVNGAWRAPTIDAARVRWLRGVADEKKNALIPAGWFEQWSEATWATARAVPEPTTIQAPSRISDGSAASSTKPHGSPVSSSEFRSSVRSTRMPFIEPPTVPRLVHGRG